MKQVVKENPVINSPFDEPRRHFRFSDEGITNEIVSERRTSSYFIPIAAPKKNLAEVAKNQGNAWIENEIRRTNEDANPKLHRVACKIRDPWDAQGLIRATLRAR
jgi:type III restriction enzyme